MPETLRKIRIKKVLGPINAGTAVLLGNENKTFVMFIGTFEGAAILRQLNAEPPPRPMTHELLDHVLTAFEVEVKKVVISSIVDNTFCATLVLQQQCLDGNEEFNGKRNEVRIDARPSDCLVLALKGGVDIFATQTVLDKVHDISDGIQLGAGSMGPPAKPQGSFGLKELDLTGLKDQFEGLDFDAPPESEED